MMGTSIKKIAAIISAAALSASMLIPVYASTDTLAGINSANDDTIATAVTAYLTDVEKIELYNQLPECDQNEINERILKNAPYADNNALAEAYQTALEYTTQVDKDLYDTVLLEDFSKGEIDTSVWQIGVVDYPPFVGDKDIPELKFGRKSLNISGEENMSMATWGRGTAVDPLVFNVDGKQQRGGTQYLIKTIKDPNVIITGYFYNANTTNKVDYYEFRINEKTYRVGVVKDGPYVYYNNSNVPFEIKSVDKNTWHKVEFDGASEPGYITAYFDGKDIFTVKDEIKELRFGTFASTEDNFSVFFTDNITIAKPKETVEVTYGTDTLTDKLPENATGNVDVKVLNPQYKKDYIIATYNGKRLVTAEIITKAELKDGTTTKSVSIEGADAMKILCCDDIDTMAPAGDPVCLTK